MDACIANGSNDTDSESVCNSLSNGIAICENGTIEPTVLMELLASLNMDSVYFSEKLVNLDLFMSIVSLGEIGLRELSILNNNISDVELEKALIFDLSFGYLNSEITELGNFLEVLQANMIDARQKICSFEKRKDIFTNFHGKLQASENSWRHLQEQLSELKRQLANFHRTLSFFRENSTYLNENEDLESSNYDLQIAGQQRLVLSMLEKSLATELDLEKQLIESKRREEELKSKLLLTNDVVSGMESFLGVALEKLLEAEHASQIFKGISKEMMSRLQICEFNMHCSVRREEELKSRLEDSLEQLKEKENVEHKLKGLEEKLKTSESKLQEVEISYEASQEQLSEMEDTTETLREHVLMAETRAHDAEEKLATLTEENTELREEVGFLKAGDSHEEKISLLEKQVRDLEVKFQTSKISSEASLEQQNMLYSAIWDMETLIEELKSKVSKAESRVETADKECLALAETNLELNKQIGNLKAENGKFVDLQKEVSKMEVARAKEIKKVANVFTEMAMQLASERERVQKQLSSLARENTILLEELQKMRKNFLGANQSSKEADRIDIDSTTDNPATGVSTNLSNTEEVVETPTSATASNQVDEPSEENNPYEMEAAGTARSAAAVADNCTNHDNAEATANCTNHDDSEAAVNCTNYEKAANCTNYENAANCTNHEVAGKLKIKKQNSKKSYILAAVFVLMFSILAMNINWQDMYHYILP